MNILHFGKLSKPREYNVLLLGETGAGKSTWINAITNYLKFRSLSRVKETNFVIRTDTCFPVGDKNFWFKPKGKAEEASTTIGHSITSVCNTYQIKYRGDSYNIIDTPGFGDTRGIEQDQYNINLVLKFIKEIYYIHGICILLKATDIKIVPSYKFCILQILSQLPREMKDNIYFCFTHSKSYMFKISEAHSVLSALLESLNIHYDKIEKHYVILENDCYRYLCMKYRSKEIFEKDHIKEYEESWNKSVKETKKFFKKLTYIKEQETKKTISLNKARNEIHSIIKAEKDVCKVIEENIKHLKQEKATIKDIKETDDLHNKLDVSFTAYRKEEPTPYNLICTNEKCIDNISKKDNINIRRFGRCAKDCEKEEDIFRNEVFNNKICSICKCHSECHEFTNCHIARIRLKIFGKNERREFKHKKTLKLKKNYISKKIQKEIENQTTEKEKIKENLQKLCAFLHNTALCGYNASLTEYLSYLIVLAEVEDKKDKDRIAHLKKMKEDAVVEMVHFENNQNSNDQNMTVENAMSIIRNLDELAISGAVFSYSKEMDRLNHINYSHKHLNVYEINQHENTSESSSSNESDDDEDTTNSSSDE